MSLWINYKVYWLKLRSLIRQPVSSSYTKLYNLKNNLPCNKQPIYILIKSPIFPRGVARFGSHPELFCLAFTGVAQDSKAPSFPDYYFNDFRQTCCFFKMSANVMPNDGWLCNTKAMLLKKFIFSELGKSFPFYTSNPYPEKINKFAAHVRIHIEGQMDLYTCFHHRSKGQII